MTLNERKMQIFNKFEDIYAKIVESRNAVDYIIYKNKPQHRLEFHQIKDQLAEEMKRLNAIWKGVRNLD